MSPNGPQGPTVVLARTSMGDPAEWAACHRYLPLVESVVGIRDQLVVGRYSVLPFYQEVARDLDLQGSRLHTTYRQHRYIASGEYLRDLGDLTPRTWFNLTDVPDAGGPYVVKGCTNSRKLRWNTQMFAPTRTDVTRIATELLADPLIGEQGVLVRQFVPLRVLEVGLYDLPFANEWRCFFWGTTLLAHGFYWSEMTEQVGTWTAAAEAVARAAAARLAPQVAFMAIDVAETATGDWIVIEVNDGQMAGLSGVDPDVLYAGLASALATASGAPQLSGGGNAPIVDAQI